MAKQPEPVISYLPEKPLGLWAGFFTVSFILHVLVVVIILFFPSETEVTAVMPPAPKAIKIDLVAFDPELPSLRSKTIDVEKKEKHNIVKIKKTVKKRAIKKGAKRKTIRKSKPVKKIKKSLKKRTFHPEKIIQQAVSKIEKKVESDRPEAVSERINQIKKDFGNKDSYISALEKRIASINPGNLKAEDLSRLQVYQAVVADIMRRNWVFSDKLAGDVSGLESRVVIKILPDGTITDVWFDKRSGNSYLDESAERTVKKSNPLPPLPAGIPYYHLVLGFTPSGIRK